MRRNIFEIIAQNNTIDIEVDRLITLTEDEILFRNMKQYTLFGFFSDYCFNHWKQRGHCLDFDDFLNTVDIEAIKYNTNKNEDGLLNYLELLCNIYKLSDEKLKELTMLGNQFGVSSDLHMIKRIIDDLLSQYNQKQVYFEDEEKVIIVEDKPEVTAVAEIIKQELAYPVINYNHRSLKGDLEKKKQILRDMGDDLEPKRPKLKEINNGLSSSVFYMLNNLNIRHNNVSKGDGNYKEYVAKMKPDEIEEWYDELYQMMLLAYLMLDNVDRKKRFDVLKKDIEGAGDGQAENAE